VAPISAEWASGGGTVAIAFDSLDRAVIASVITAQDYRPHLEVRRFEAGRWVQLGCNLTQDRVIQVRMALGPQGTIALVWEGLTPAQQREIGVSLWDGATWQSLPRPYLTGSSAGSMAISLLGGEPIVGWGLESSSGPTRSFVAHWNGSCWEPMAGALTGPIGQSTQVSSIAVDRDGTPMLLLAVGLEQSAGSAIQLRKWNGTEWLSQAALPQPHALIQSVIDLQLDRLGRPVVAWNDFDPLGTTPPLLFGELARFDDGGWTLLGTHPGALVTAVAPGTHDDQPWLSLTQRGAGDTLPSLSVEHWNGTTWESALNGLFHNQVASDVELAVNSQGQPAAIWVSGDPGSVDPFMVRVWQPASTVCP
jgi:hypothetical protein